MIHSMMAMIQRLQRNVKSRLIMGIIILIPIGITLFLLKFILKFAYKLSKGMIPSELFTGAIPEGVIMTLAFILIALFVYLVGSLGSHYAGKQIIAFWEKIFLSIPLVKSIYNASKQLVTTLSLTSNQGFKSVCFVEFPAHGGYVIGFITGTVKGKEEQLLYKIFIPTTPNPTSGYMVFFPAQKVVLSDMSVEDALQTVISGGIVSPPQIQL